MQVKGNSSSLRSSHTFEPEQVSYRNRRILVTVFLAMERPQIEACATTGWDKIQYLVPVFHMHAEIPGLYKNAGLLVAPE